MDQKYQNYAGEQEFDSGMMGADTQNMAVTSTPVQMPAMASAPAQIPVLAPPPKLTPMSMNGIDYIPSKDGRHLVLRDEVNGFKNCCEPGGCCRITPARNLYNQQGRLVRLNIPYHATSCCGASNGITGEHQIVPAELMQKGITQSRWDYWTKDQLWEVQRVRAGCCCSCACCMVVIFLPCFIPCICSSFKRTVEEWTSRLWDWQKNFNNQDLLRLGVFVKTKSHADVHYDKDGKKRNIERWLAFSLDPEDTQMLVIEPHLSGDVERGCCGGPSEVNCVMHP